MINTVTVDITADGEVRAHTFVPTDKIAIRTVTDENNSIASIEVKIENNPQCIQWNGISEENYTTLYDNSKETE